MQFLHSLALLAAFSTSFVTAKQNDRVLNLMNVGDSITARHCWRGFLYDNLVDSGYGDDITFVGNQNRTIEITPWKTIKTCDWKHNDTYSDRHDGIPKYSTKMVAKEIDQWLAGIPKPDIVQIMLGANDPTTKVPLNATEIYFRKIINRIRHTNKNAAIIMTMPMPRKSTQKKIDRINEGIPHWVNEWNSTQSPIFIADASLQGGYDPKMELKDRVHPDTAGEYYLGDVLTPVVIQAIKWVRQHDICGDGNCEKGVAAALGGLDLSGAMYLATMSEYRTSWGHGLLGIFAVSGAIFACLRYRRRRFR